MAKLIGTAGHVDHGKTTLIKALTGIDADRLPEEKKRGMTIDVGFAYVDLPGHGRVSIVDVPGHERFITNMLVGALGIDVALLCVSADEAVMPQTREHLQILELLPVEKLVVALTRADLADPETREFATLEVAELVAASRFAQVPIVPVSAVTGEGLDTLREALAAALGESGDRSPHSKEAWYLPIDRVFTVKGHGCVVTGTLARGTVRVGDRAFLEPGHYEVRIRGIEIHDEPAQESERGTRTALNLAGARQEDVSRGMSLGAPGALFDTEMIDARMHWVTQPKHGQRVRVSIGADEAIAKVFLSSEDTGVAQLRIESKVAAAMDQPLIVRRYSPPDLLGGGRVVLPQAKPRRRKEKVEVVEEQDLPLAILQVVAENPNGVATEEICRLLSKSPQALGQVFEDLGKTGALKGFAGHWFSEAGYRAGAIQFLEGLTLVHAKNPSRASVPREPAVKTAGLEWAGKPLDRLMSAMAAEGLLEVYGTNVRAPNFSVDLAPRQRQLLDRVKEALVAESVNVPNPYEISKTISVPSQAVDEIIKIGLQAGELVAVGEGVFYTPAQLAALKERVREVTGGKPFAASAVRDALGTTRKYVIPLLEHFDSIRFTVRVGDMRVIQGPG